MELTPRWLVARRDDATAAEILAAIERGPAVALLHPGLTAPERDALQQRIELTALPTTAAVVIFTSGSTGAAKGVVLSARAFAASAAAHAANLPWRSDDRWLCCLSLAHIGGLSIVTRCAAAGRDAVLAAEAPFDPEKLAATIAAERITLLSVVPAMLARLVDELPEWRAPAHLRAVLVGGARAGQALIARARERGVPVLTTYGMTETCSQIYTGGKLLPGVELRTVDGRLQLRGPMLAEGYIDEDGFRPLTGADGWYDTGDLGHLDDRGALHVLGRADDCIISGGANVAPAEVERALETCPDVRAACVFGVPDPVWGQLVAAAIVPATAADDTTHERLAAFVRDHLASYKRPRRICLVDALPRGLSGKIDRGRAAQLTRDRLRPW